MSSAFYSHFSMESRPWSAEHFNYIAELHWYPKLSRLAFICKSSRESTRFLLARVTVFISGLTSSCFSQSGSFLRSSKRGLRMKEKFTTRLTLNFAKIASSHFSSSEKPEKYNLAFSKNFSNFWTNQFFLSRKIDRKVLQTAPSNCITSCQKGSRRDF